MGPGPPVLRVVATAPEIVVPLPPGTTATVDAAARADELEDQLADLRSQGTAKVVAEQAELVSTLQLELARERSRAEELHACNIGLRQRLSEGSNAGALDHLAARCMELEEALAAAQGGGR